MKSGHTGSEMSMGLEEKQLATLILQRFQLCSWKNFVKGELMDVNEDVVVTKRMKISQRK